MWKQLLQPDRGDAQKRAQQTQSERKDQARVTRRRKYRNATGLAGWLAHSLPFLNGLSLKSAQPHSLQGLTAAEEAAAAGGVEEEEAE